MDETDIDFFLSETNALDSSICIEPPLPCFHEEATGSTTSIPPPPKQHNDHLETLAPTNTQMPAMTATSGLPPTNPTCLADTMDQRPAYFTNKSFLTDEQPPFTFMNQDLPMNPNEQLPPSACFHTQISPVNPETNTESNSEEQSGSSRRHPQANTKDKHHLSVGDLSNHDQEAVMFFLAGLVRPGPDVAQIYKCIECSLEFPNAQAYGGHMSSHSKSRRVENKRSKQGGIVGSSSHPSGTKKARKSKAACKGKSKDKAENDGI